MKKKFKFENVNAYIHFRVMDNHGKERQLYLVFNEDWLGAPNVFDRFSLLGSRMMECILKKDKTVFRFQGFCHRSKRPFCRFLIYRKVWAVYRPSWVNEDGTWEVAEECR